jgi:RNA 3'-terminal phosphate cyclase
LLFSFHPVRVDGGKMRSRCTGRPVSFILQRLSQAQLFVRRGIDTGDLFAQ